MTSSPAEPRPRSIGRWWAVVIVVFLVQAALFQPVLKRPSVRPGKTAAVPMFRLGYRPSRQWMALEDPTLFALPHYEGFSGGAWLKIPSFEFSPADWVEPLRLYSLSTADLGASFINFVQTNPPSAFATIVSREPRLTLPELARSGPLSVPSRLRVEGDLAKRHLLSHFDLPAWSSGDLLTNSVMQLLVDAQGNTVSTVLLPPGSGSREADQRAAQLARSARFEPRAGAPAPGRDPSAGLTVGRMIFQWQTLPPPSTNGPAATP